MRLWTLAILDQLPRQQLLGQHRECCALRGKGWGRKHATVNYVFEHPYYCLYMYHRVVMSEMMKRKMCPDEKWLVKCYRGKNVGMDYSDFTAGKDNLIRVDETGCFIYPEHDAAYLAECVENLARKGVKVEIPKEKAAV